MTQKYCVSEQPHIHQITTTEQNICPEKHWEETFEIKKLEKLYTALSVMLKFEGSSQKSVGQIHIIMSNDQNGILNTCTPGCEQGFLECRKRKLGVTVIKANI